MHGMAARGMDLALKIPTVDHLLRCSNRMVSGKERDLLKTGLSQGTVIEVAKQVFAKHGLPVRLVDPYGTSSTCPVCGGPFWERTTTRIGARGGSGGARSASSTFIW